MRREDLFAAIGEVEESRLMRCEKVMNPSVIVYWEDPNMYGRKSSMRKFWLIAAVIALTLCLMGSAIAALVKMDVENTKVIMEKEEVVGEEVVIQEKVYEGEKITFEEVHDTFVELGNYYPQQIPAGYALTFVSSGTPLQNREIRYENSSGGMIRFDLYLGDPASSVELYEIEEKTELTVNGLPGILYQQSGDRRALVWADEEHGYGFALRVNDPAVDILCVAESVAEGEALKPTHSEETKKALEELGDFSPQYLPAGYEELEVQGWPLMEDSWYSYVRKWYINKEENNTIYFEYETYKIVTEDGYTDNAKTAASFFIPGYASRREEIVAEDVVVSGMVGIQSDNHIAWADETTHQVFHLYSEDVSGEELLKVAQSIRGK